MVFLPGKPTNLTSMPLNADWHVPGTAHQIDREVSFEITMTFIIENVTLDYTKNNEKS